MKKTILLIVFTLTYTVFAQSIDFSGYLRNYTGMLVGNGSNDFVILQNTFNLNIESRHDNSFFKVNPMIYHDFADSITFRLRESYMDFYFDNFDLRTGIQQIVWGKADGVFITDIVSPLDLFQFLLPEFDEIRIGVVGAKFDYYLGDNTFEIVWLPVFTPTKYADPNSVWAIEPTFPIIPTFDYSNETVKPSLENSELFLKYSALTTYIDFEIMGGYMWDDNPTMFSSFVPDSTGGMNLIISPEHMRLPIAGGSFSTTLGPVVLRGEGAYYWGKYYNTTTPQIDNGVIQKDYIHYMLGVDFTLWSINFSTQFIQTVIMDYEPILKPTPLVSGEYNTMMTYLARYSTLNETLTLEIFSYYDFGYDDALIRPRILYDYSDSINLQFGANIFTGTEGIFGQYNKNDMIYGKIIYSF
ncbi:MAG: hypothetical protein KAQ62_27220 [Cyclobacteriaceae bacterium]|nr:hypothetical protein [Cyclobacteriaceae bacterium]